MGTPSTNQAVSTGWPFDGIKDAMCKALSAARIAAPNKQPQRFELCPAAVRQLEREVSPFDGSGYEPYTLATTGRSFQGVAIKVMFSADELVCNLWEPPSGSDGVSIPMRHEALRPAAIDSLGCLIGHDGTRLSLFPQA